VGSGSLVIGQKYHKRKKKQGKLVGWFTVVGFWKEEVYLNSSINSKY